MTTLTTFLRDRWRERKEQREQKEKRKSDSLRPAATGAKRVEANGPRDARNYRRQHGAVPRGDSQGQVGLLRQGFFEKECPQREHKSGAKFEERLALAGDTHEHPDCGATCWWNLCCDSIGAPGCVQK